MLASFKTLSQQAFLILRRDQIFLAGIILSLAMTMMAHLIFSWTLVDSYKILYDILAFSLNFFGNMIAIFWGTNCLGTEQKSQYTLGLSGPVSRSLWLLSQYMGLLQALFGLLLINALVWQIGLLLPGYSFLSLDQLMMFPMHFLSWMVASAASVFFVSFCSRSTSLFCAFCLWITGLIGPLLPLPNNDPFLENILKFTRVIWNLQYFNVVPGDGLSINTFLLTASYAFCLVACFLFAACQIFTRRDL